MENVHYLLESVREDNIELTIPCNLNVIPERKIVSFPCCRDQIQPIVSEIIRLTRLKSDASNKVERERYERELNERQRELSNIVGYLSKVWKILGLSEIPIISAAAASTVIVGTVQTVGFSLNGIVGGSWAAAMVSSLGSNSMLVGTLQSIGATGVLSAAGTACAVLSGLLLVGVLCIYVRRFMIIASIVLMTVGVGNFLI